MPDITLYYFGVYSRAEAIRMMANKAGIDYVDKYYDFEEWKNDIKANIHSGKCPAIEFPDGKIIGESVAISRFVAKKAGFYPEDPVEAAEVDMLVDFYMDVLPKIYYPAFMHE